MINKRRTFNLLLVAQSLGAFGDNAVYAVIVGMLLNLVKSGQMTMFDFGVASAVYANCLFLPFVLGAPIVGWLSDRFTKKRILVSANIMKAFGSTAGLAGIMLGSDWLFVSYLLIGTGAAVYSPSKYGIIPELKSEEELVKANAAVEMTTIFSILFGIIGGGLLIDKAGPRNSFAVLSLVYLLAAFLNLLMENTNLCNKEERLGAVWSEFAGTLRNMFSNKLLFIPIMGTAVFWSSASFIKLNLQTWGQDVLKLTTATGISLLALWLSIGIIIGSFAAGRLFRTGQIKQSWLFGFFMGGLVLFMAGKYINYGAAMFELILLGALGGIFLIPLNAAVQAQSEFKNIGKVIAIQNFYENCAMLLSAAAFWYMSKLSLSPVATFTAVGLFLCIINLAYLKPLLKDFKKALFVQNPEI